MQTKRDLYVTWLPRAFRSPELKCDHNARKLLRVFQRQYQSEFEVDFLAKQPPQLSRSTETTARPFL